VSQSAFEDFDKIEDFADPVSTAIVVNQTPAQKEHTHSHSAFSSSRLAYPEEEKPSTQTYNSTFSSSTGSSTGSSTPISSKVKPQNPQPIDVGDAQKRFSNAKSISSAQYFGEESKVSDNEKEQRMMKFQGAHAISSADYFDRNEESDNFTSKFGSTDLSQLTTIVADGSKKFSSMASDFLADMQSRYQ